MKFHPVRVFAWVCLATACWVSPARATIVKYLEVEELARFSTGIFHGQVLSAEAFWNTEHTRIHTAVRLRVNESFKGTARRGEVVTVTQLGGEIDGIRMDYAGRPEFTAGESVVLFTTQGRPGERTVVALKQGKMRVAGAEVTRDFSGLTLLESAGGGTQPRMPAARSSRLTLDELRARIARVKQEGR